MSEIQRLEAQLAALKAREKKSFAPGTMIGVVTKDPSGRPITRYEGHPAACWDQFSPPIRYVAKILVPDNR